MKIHYFQRYHAKENVDTANAMLLLSRLYSYSSDKFYLFLSKILPDQINVELYFNLQEKIVNSVPDATISQPSFKIVVETKLHGGFTLEQLQNHLDSFKVENYKVLLTLDPNPMDQAFSESLDAAIKLHNTENCSAVIHRHLTFEELFERVSEVVDDRDFDMTEVMDDYRTYCSSSGLFTNEKRMMHVQLAGSTMEINKRLNLYYNDVNRGFSGHSYLGLYAKKAVRAVGKIIAIVTAAQNGNNLDIQVEKGKPTKEMLDNIPLAIKDGKNYGYDLSLSTRYFFVDKFYDTFFEKKTPNAPMGTRVFNLCDVLKEKTLPSTEQIAKRLQECSW